MKPGSSLGIDRLWRDPALWALIAWVIVTLIYVGMEMGTQDDNPFYDARGMIKPRKVMIEP